MKKLILIILLLTTSTNVNAQDLPPNPKAGECYAYCLRTDSKGEKVWIKIPCDLVRKDSTQIKAIQYKLINSGYDIVATGFINTETSEAYIDFKNNSKKLKRKLRREKRKKSKD